MNPQIKKAVKLELTRRDMTQKELAETIGVNPRQLSATMTGRINQLPSAWSAVLEALDLELIAVPRRRMKRIADELELPDEGE